MAFRMRTPQYDEDEAAPHNSFAGLSYQQPKHVYYLFRYNEDNN